jgi:hypothetical protein
LALSWSWVQSCGSLGAVVRFAPWLTKPAYSGYVDVAGTVICLTVWFKARTTYWKTFAGWLTLLAGVTSLPDLVTDIATGNVSGGIGAIVWIGVGAWMGKQLWEVWRHPELDVE